MSTKKIKTIRREGAGRPSSPPVEHPPSPEESEEDREMREKHGCIPVKAAAIQAKRSEQSIYNAIRREDVKGMERAGKTYVTIVSLNDWIGPNPIAVKVAERKEKARAARNR